MQKPIELDFYLINQEEKKMLKTRFSWATRNEWYGHSITIRFYRLRLIVDVIKKEHRR